MPRSCRYRSDKSGEGLVESELMKISGDVDCIRRSLLAQRREIRKQADKSAANDMLPRAQGKFRSELDSLTSALEALDLTQMNAFYRSMKRMLCSRIEDLQDKNCRLNRFANSSLNLFPQCVNVRVSFFAFVFLPFFLLPSAGSRIRGPRRLSSGASVQAVAREDGIADA
eukprot:GHVU01191079.1.p1 GENE.GHVU01191079.1~~GHVU01191079.1.p1  ORF type:complete len:170 (+),score=15.75 GHVU01191079.1:411-920(+)